MLIAELHDEIKHIRQNSSHAAAQVKVVAVSKLQPIEKIKSLYLEQHHTIFGENYPQEALEKIRKLESFSIEWHLIGHLQKNKINSILGQFKLIHSIDSFDLALTLSQKAQAKSLTENILLQVNIAEEESKGGFHKEALLDLWDKLSTLPNLKIHGLMTMPPLYDNPENTRPHFAELRQLLNILKKQSSTHPLSELSMGTSHDYKVALEEGATLIRLGTILFGERPRGKK